jgi:hypothetical protein
MVKCVEKNLATLAQVGPREKIKVIQITKCKKLLRNRRKFHTAKSAYQ